MPPARDLDALAREVLTLEPGGSLLTSDFSAFVRARRAVQKNLDDEQLLWTVVFFPHDAGKTARLIERLATSPVARESRVGRPHVLAYEQGSRLEVLVWPVARATQLERRLGGFDLSTSEATNRITARPSR